MLNAIDARSDPVFVVGCPRSGTTLLSVLLDRHRALAITPETAFYDEVAPGLLNHSSVPMLLERWPRLAELGLQRDRVVARAGLRPSRAQLLRALLELYAEDRGKLRCGEKTPQHLRHVPAILRDFPGARVLCLVRDGRDVALSLSAMPWWKHGLEAAALAWLEAVRLMERLTTDGDGRVLVVRYEHLVMNPETLMTNVMQFLGLQLDPDQLVPSSSGVVLPRSHAWKGRALEAIDSAAIMHRRKSARPDELERLHTLLGPTLERLAYG